MSGYTKLNLEDVETDALGLVRLVEQTITFGLRQCGFDGVFGEWLEIEHDVPRILRRFRAISAPPAGPVRGQPHAVLGTKRLSREAPPRRAGRPVRGHPQTPLQSRSIT